MTAREVMWVGVDAGKQAHHAVAVDAEGRLLWSTRVANDQAAIEALVARAGRSGAEVCWAVDLTCAAATLLLALLVTAGQRVVYVPGRTVNRMAGAFAGEGKTDAKDARIIADTARLRRDLTELSTPNELVVEMSLLVAQRADLMGDWVRGVNRLRELLTAIFPALERTFDYTTRSALILVAGYQTPQAIREAGPDGLAAHLSEAGAWRKGIPSMVDKALAAAAAQTIRLPAEATTAALIARLARRLLDLDREIKDTDKLLTERFRTHPQAKIIESMPGMGPILGAEFLVATGGDLAAFGTSARLAAYAGLRRCPAIPAAAPATCTAQSATTAACAGSSTWPPCPASAPAAPPRRTTDANARNDCATPRPSSPWPADSSTCCGHSFVTIASSTTHPHSPRGLDMVIEIPFVGSPVNYPAWHDRTISISIGHLVTAGPSSGEAVPEERDDLRPCRPRLGHHARHAEERVGRSGVFGELCGRPGLAQPSRVRTSVIGQRVVGRHHHQRRSQPAQVAGEQR